MKKMKRYDEGGDTSEEMANSSTESQDIANEAKGEGMLKSMRDEAAKPKAMAKAAPKNPNYSNEGRNSPAPAAKTTPTTPKVGRAGQGSGIDRSTEKYDQLNRDIEARKQSSITNPSLLSRLFSVGSQRDRKYKTETKMAKGGSASSRADGIAMKGKTRGKLC